jgi:putative ABC transport system permease protein
MSVHRPAVAYCVRADARRSWPAWLALGLLLGLAAGAVVAAAAGARRTDSAYRDLRTETNAMTGAVVFACDRAADPTCVPTTQQVLAWPGVVDATPVAVAHVPIVDAHERVVQANRDPCSTGTGEVDLIVPLEGRFAADFTRLQIFEGRAADPARADEAVLAPVAAEEFGVEVGEVLTVFPGPETECDDRAHWEDPVELTVVGIGMTAAEIQPKSGFYVQGLHATPAFAAEHLPDDPESSMAIRLEPGTTFDDLAQAPGVTPFEVAFDLSALAEDIDAGLRADANALWLVAGLGGLASLFVVGPALARQAAAAAGVDATLTPMGWSRRDRVARAVAHGVIIGVIAVAVATVVALVASTRTPIGDARAIEPQPGAELDLAPLVLVSAGAILLTCLLLALLGARRLRPAAGRRTPMSRTAARMGLPPSAVLGLRTGLEPGRRQAPVRSSLFAVAVGAAAVVGALVYTGSAQHLRETPRLAGVAWDDFFFISDRDDGLELAEHARDWPEAERVGTLGFFTPSFLLGEDQHLSRVLAYSTEPDDIEPPVISGRPPSGPSELVIGPLLADATGLGVGDEVTGAFELGIEDDRTRILSEARTYEVVGIGPVPIADGNFDVGVGMTLDGYRQAVPPETDEGNELEFRPDFLTVDWAPGVTNRAITELMGAEGFDIEGEPLWSEDLLQALVAIDVTSTESAPDLLALLMVVMAGSVLAYVVATTISRDRHDLAIARSLGFAPRHIRRTAAWAATSFTVVALAIAIPLGIVAGRITWRAYAESLGVIPTPVLPWTEIATFAGAAVLAANLVAFVAAWRQNRLLPAEPLRAE